jgi:hypothetical protein
MKYLFRPFMRRLLKENIFYLIGGVFLLVLIVITIKTGITENLNYDKKNASLKTELNLLEKKVTLMRTTIPSTEKLSEDLDFLNKLIPNVEDYFSIIYALEKLSQKTNFIVISYTVAIQGSTAEKLKLNITGMGDSESFINFLKNYNFEGGRLITSDKIQLNSNFSGTVTVDLTFYTKKVPINQNSELTFDSKVFQELETLKSKVNFAFESNEATAEANLDYPKKQNPF